MLRAAGPVLLGGLIAVVIYNKFSYDSSASLTVCEDVTTSPGPCGPAVVEFCRHEETAHVCVRVWPLECVIHANASLRPYWEARIPPKYRPSRPPDGEQWGCPTYWWTPDRRLHMRAMIVVLDMLRFPTSPLPIGTIYGPVHSSSLCY
jgi:hypothetical protein